MEKNTEWLEERKKVMVKEKEVQAPNPKHNCNFNTDRGRIEEVE